MKTGMILMRDVGPGEYRFVVDAPGYRTASRESVRLVAAGNPALEFELERE